MEYEVYTNDEGKRRVKFLDCNDEDYSVEKDENGMEYFSIPNVLNPKYKESIFARLFSGRVKDAVEVIKLGYADVLNTSSIFGSNSVKPIRFVDREYGESLRAKSIDGWKDTEFAYVIRVNPMGFGSSSTVLSDGKFGNALSKNLMFFNSEVAAQEWLDNYRNEVDMEVDIYLKSDEANKDKMLDDIFKNGFSIHTEMFKEILDEKEGNESKVQIRVEQEAKAN